MTQFAADDFAYIAAKQREIAAEEAFVRASMVNCQHCQFAFPYHAAPALRCPNCGNLDPVARNAAGAVLLDMDAANEPADFSTGNMQIKCRERRPIECVMCFHKWSGFTADDCPSCKAKNPEIPF